MPLFGPPNVEKLKRKSDISGLLKCLNHAKSSVRKGAATALSDLRSVEAVEPLLASLRDKEQDVRASAAAALGHIGDSRALNPLLRLLFSELSPFDNIVAAEALGNIGNRCAVPPLTRCLQSRPTYSYKLHADPRVRAAAARALAKLADSRALDALIVAIKKDRDAKVRSAAALSLGEMADKRATDPLVMALRDCDGAVRQAAKEALTKLMPLEEVEKQVHEAEVDNLIVALRNERDSFARHSSALKLGDLKEIRAVRPLIVMLKEDREVRVCAAAALALGAIGNPRAVAPLNAALNRKWIQTDSEKRLDPATDEWYFVPKGERKTGSILRASAAKALGEIGSLQAVEPLISALQDETWAVREAAAVALGKLGDKRAAGPLVALLEDENTAVRQATAVALKKLES